MPKNRWDKKFFESTRGRVIMLLRSGCQTVEELAQELDITDNAVRAHLAVLERDGLVEQSGSRRGGGKPAYIYELTGEAERLFPKAYDLVLNRLLTVLSLQKSSEEVANLLRQVGRQLAAEQKPATGNIKTRLEASVNLLNELGGMAILEEKDSHFLIRGFSCPLATLIPDHPQVCQLAETLLSEYSGLNIKEQCNQQEPARCSFRIVA